MKQSTKTFIKLEPESGFLTQSTDVDIQSRLFAKVIYLGTDDVPENYKEITEEEYHEYMKELKQLLEYDVHELSPEIQEYINSQDSSLIEEEAEDVSI